MQSLTDDKLMKTGDDVKCVNNFGIWTLREGQVYRVLDTRDNTIQVQGKHGCTNWYKKDRFVKIKEGLHMSQLTKSDVKVGDKVVRLSGTGLRVGAEFTVISVNPSNSAVRLQGQGGNWYCISTFSIVERVKPQHGVLTDDQVFKHLADGVELEYFFDNQWHKIDNPKGVSIQFIQTTQFRKKRDLMEVNGVKVPKGITRAVHFDERGIGYGVSFNKREVFKAPLKQLNGTMYWTDPEDAHEVLCALLKPFGMYAKPLKSNLLES